MNQKRKIYLWLAISFFSLAMVNYLGEKFNQTDGRWGWFYVFLTRVGGEDALVVFQLAIGAVFLMLSMWERKK